MVLPDCEPIKCLCNCPVIEALIRDLERRLPLLLDLDTGRTTGQKYMKQRSGRMPTKRAALTN